MNYEGRTVESTSWFKYSIFPKLNHEFISTLYEPFIVTQNFESRTFSYKWMILKYLPWQSFYVSKVKSFLGYGFLKWKQN